MAASPRWAVPLLFVLLALSFAAGIWGTLSLGLFATGQYGAPGQTGATLYERNGKRCLFALLTLLRCSTGQDHIPAAGDGRR